MAGPDYWWIKICAAFGGRCAYCLATDRQLTRDHYIPKALGGKGVNRGLHQLGLVVPACGDCNGRKGARMAADLEWLSDARRMQIEFILGALDVKHVRVVELRAAKNAKGRDRSPSP